MSLQGTVNKKAIKNISFHYKVRIRFVESCFLFGYVSFQVFIFVTVFLYFCFYLYSYESAYDSAVNEDLLLLDVRYYGEIG